MWNCRERAELRREPGKNSRCERGEEVKACEKVLLCLHLSAFSFFAENVDPVVPVLPLCVSVEKR